MPSKHNLPLLASLLVASPMLLLTSCAGSSTRPAIVKPAPERLEPVTEPVIPDATTPCAYDPAQACLTDAETADVIQRFAGALRAANDRLLWLRDWFAALPGK